MGSRPVDELFADQDLAKLYDTFCAGRPDFRFYLPLVMAADAVLDVGCGTGELLRLARRSGHVGRLVGVDPAPAMLEIAQANQPDVEWILGDIAAVPDKEPFALVVMTGHVFQVFLADSELHDSLQTIRSLLDQHGRLVFESRNPSVREWEHWTFARPIAVMAPDGSKVLYSRVVDRVVNDRVEFRQIYDSPRWDQPKVSHSTLRFLDANSIGKFLAEAGFTVERQVGDWDQSPLTDSSPEIITVASPVAVACGDRGGLGPL
mgnify:CR=1 FL=1